MTTSKRNTPQEWQKDPSNVKTSKVQFWTNGIMLTAQMTNAEARTLVANGTAFVISDQAIGALKNGRYAS